MTWVGGESLDIWIDLIIIVLVILICFLLYKLYYILFVKSYIKKTRVAIDSSNFREAHRLLVYAVKKKPKNEEIIYLTKLYNQKMKVGDNEYNRKG